MPTVEARRPLSLFAPAKVNLGLEVLRRRPDGFHEVVTILQAVSVYDRIDLLPAGRLAYRPLAGVEPADDLVWRALNVAEDTLGVALVAEVRLHKAIPMAAGLGGGSSDAGTLLGALAAMAGLPRSAAEEAAAPLGSDVPFFVRGGTALATGTGSTLTPLPDASRVWFTLVTPEVTIPAKTRTLYCELKEADFGNGRATRALAALIRDGQTFDPELLRNSFTRPLLERAGVREAAAAMAMADARRVVPCGAGPSLFAPSRTFAEARALADGILEHGLACRVCTTVQAGINDARLAGAVRAGTLRVLE